MRITTHPPESSKVTDPSSLPVAVEGKRLSGMSSSEEEGEPEPESEQPPQMTTRAPGEATNTVTNAPAAHPLAADAADAV